MKWSSSLIATVAALGLVLGSATAEAKKTKRKPASQNVSLDDIELDEDETPTPSLKQPSKSRATSADQSNKSDPAAAVDSVASAGDQVSPEIKEALSKATAFEEKKSYEDVTKTLKPFVSQLPRHGVLMLSRAYRATKNFQGELQLLEVLLARNDKDYVVKTQEADALSKLNRFEESADAYKAAKDLNKQYRPAYEGHWVALEKAKDIYEARAALSDLIKIFGPTAKSQSQLCRLYTSQDFLEKSEETCRKAIELDPKNPENYVHLGMSLRDQEQSEAAVKVLTDAAKRFPASENVLTSAADLKASKKDFAVSYDLYKKATVVDAKSTRSWLGLAKSAHELQKYPEALEAFKKSCAMDRKNSIQVRNAGMELKKNGNEKLAQTYFDAAFDCDNNN